MKLRNKKTGEIKDAIYPGRFVLNVGHSIKAYNSLAELNEEWEDYEEPKEYWYVDEDGEVWHHEGCKCEDRPARKSIGNYFETEEEAEKAVEKLKAWKRLKDKGFRFTGWKNGILLDETVAGQVRYEFPIGNKDNVEKDLDLLFGGENGKD